MKHIFIALILFLVGFLGVLGFRCFQVYRMSTFIPVTSTFALQPPSQALSGVLTLNKGHAKILSRNSDDFVEVLSDAQILTGQSVASLSESSVSVAIPGMVQVDFGPKAEVSFANLFADNMVLWQKSGTVSYSLTASRPVSIRALHLLTTIYEGKITIAIDNTNIMINVPSGRAKIGLVGTDNNTHVWELVTGQRAVVNDMIRKVAISPQKLK